jgi:hypothetical protein
MNAETPMLHLHLDAPRDYSVREEGRGVGRIRWTSEGTPGKWLRHVTVTLPGPPFGDAASLHEAKARFKSAWLAFKAKHGPEQPAKAYAEMDHANRKDRYG